MNNGATRISEIREELHRVVDRITAPPTVESEITETNVDSGDMYKIENDVPLPPTLDGPIRGKRRRQIEELKVGQSFTVRTSRERNKVKMLAWHSEIPLITRVQKDGTYRIWRAEKPGGQPAVKVTVEPTEIEQ